MKKRPRLGLLLAIGTASSLAGTPIARADVDQPAPVYAVQNRRFNPRHEFHLGLGVLPLNAFTKGVTLGAGYTYHFSEMWAWEIAQFTYSFGVDTALKDQLLRDFAVQPSKIVALNWYASSSAVFTPLYGKLALTNRWVLHMEVFFVAGVAVGGFTNANAAVKEAFKTENVAAGLDVGGGFRFYISDHFSLRIDIRQHEFFRGGDTADELLLGLALSLTFGGGPR